MESIFRRGAGTTMAQHVGYRLDERGRRITLSEAQDMAHLLGCPISCVDRESMAHWSMEFEDGSLLSYWDKGPAGKPLLTAISISCAESSSLRGCSSVAKTVISALAAGGVAILLMEMVSWLCK